MTALERLERDDPALAADLTARVERGAKLLDERKPGWAALVALDRLAMENCNRCILGQVFGGFLEGSHKLDLYYNDTEPDYGFEAPNLLGEGYEKLNEQKYQTLADLWRRQVRARTEG